MLLLDYPMQFTESHYASSVSSLLPASIYLFPTFQFQTSMSVCSFLFLSRFYFLFFNFELLLPSLTFLNLFLISSSPSSLPSVVFFLNLSLSLSLSIYLSISLSLPIHLYIFQSFYPFHPISYLQLKSVTFFSFVHITKEKAVPLILLCFGY